MNQNAKIAPVPQSGTRAKSIVAPVPLPGTRAKFFIRHVLGEDQASFKFEGKKGGELNPLKIN